MIKIESADNEKKGEDLMAHSSSHTNSPDTIRITEHRNQEGMEKPADYFGLLHEQDNLRDTLDEVCTQITVLEKINIKSPQYDTDRLDSLLQKKDELEAALQQNEAALGQYQIMPNE
jgi:hypothetical protein